MDQFQKAEPQWTEAQIEALMADPDVSAQFEQYLTRLAAGELQIFANDLYTVTVDFQPAQHNWPPMAHLSIKRNDKEPIHDWRHLQEIKNQIMGLLLNDTAQGEECDAVELYPRESRLVDQANQYHLYALPDPRLGFPFGDTVRQIASPAEAAAVGAAQRPFGAPLRPLGVVQGSRAERRRILHQR